jgi:lipid II:glycine glycyltransferase (peptidoglycan interpeptide bridge formation enzyme)
MDKTYVIKSIDDKQLWDEACGSNFLQSWEWGEFQKSLERKFWRIGLYEVTHDGNGEKQELKSIAAGQLVKTKLRTHIYVANGPVFADGERPEHIRIYFEQILGYFKALALRENAKFVRFDPLFLDTPENHTLLHSLNLVRAGTHVQAETTLLLDLKKSEEALLKDMKKDTRYEIKKSEKDGVVVTKSESIDDFDRFWTLFEQTFVRQQFIPNKKEYYLNQFTTFQIAKKAKLFFAQNSEGQDLATAIIIKQAGLSVYLHAASADSKKLDLHYAPKLLLWNAIKDAKEDKGEVFDFYGVAKTDSPKDPWYGFTHFKKGFGGARRDVVCAYDYPVTPVYWLVKLLESTRAIWSFPYYKIKKLLSKKQEY